MYRYYVLGNQRLTATTLLLTLKKGPAERLLSFQPGQYAAISFKVNGRPTPVRNFSIVNSSTDQGILQFSIRIKGHFTNALTGLAIGDEVKVRGPFGAFVFDSNRDKDTVFIAGGIGIAPFMSMIRYATVTGLSNKISLIYGCKTQDDVPFADQIKSLEELNSNFKARYQISGGPIDKLFANNVNIGSVQPESIDEVVGGSYDGKTFLICGHPHFMAGMTKILLEKGVPSEKIMTEAFSQGASRQTGKIFGWPFNVYVLGAVGLAATSFVVMASDLIKTLPSASTLDTTNTASTTSSRQNDLDDLVNGLEALDDGYPASAAFKDAAKQAAAASKVTSTPVVNTTPAITTPTATTTPTSTPTPAPVVTPKPVPVCTTTQSGITTCV